MPSSIMLFHSSIALRARTLANQWWKSNYRYYASIRVYESLASAEMEVSEFARIYMDTALRSVLVETAKVILRSTDPVVSRARIRKILRSTFQDWADMQPIIIASLLLGARTLATPAPSPKFDTRIFRD